MAFKFKKKESVAKAIRRLGSECVEKALGALQEPDKLEGIHTVRKEIKKLRALLRLIRKEIGEGVYRKRTQELRKAAKYLAPPRDAQVRLQTLEAVTSHFKRQIPAHSFDRIRTVLRLECSDEAAAVQKQGRTGSVKRLMRKQPAKFECLPIHGKGWSAIGPGIKRAYRAGRKAQELAQKEPVAENFHDWRRRAKDLWYYVQLLEPIWPEQMCAVSDELEKLGELLGDEHDLHMLKLTIVKKSIVPEMEKETEILVDLLDRRQQELRASALALGTRFYAEKPSIFCGRLREFWKAWRSKAGKCQRLPSKRLISSWS